MRMLLSKSSLRKDISHKWPLRLHLLGIRLFSAKVVAPIRLLKSLLTFKNNKQGQQTEIEQIHKDRYMTDKYLKLLFVVLAILYNCKHHNLLFTSIDALFFFTAKKG